MRVIEVSQCILGIDPGKDGSACVLEELKGLIHLQAILSFEHDPEWLKKLHGWCYLFTPDKVVIELVHAFPGQGTTSMFNFGEQLGLVKAAILVTGYEPEFIEPQVWMRKLAMNPRREIVDARKRRVARRADQKEKALKLFPKLANVKGDIYASVLIAYSAL